MLGVWLSRNRGLGSTLSRSRPGTSRCWTTWRGAVLALKLIHFGHLCVRSGVGCLGCLVSRRGLTRTVSPSERASRHRQLLELMALHFSTKGNWPSLRWLRDQVRWCTSPVTIQTELQSMALAGLVRSHSKGSHIPRVPTPRGLAMSGWETCSVCHQPIEPHKGPKDD